MSDDAGRGKGTDRGTDGGTVSTTRTLPGPHQCFLNIVQRAFV